MRAPSPLWARVGEGAAEGVDAPADAMNFEEHAAKPLLARAGIAVPPSRPATTPDEAAAAAARARALRRQGPGPDGQARQGRRHPPRRRPRRGPRRGRSDPRPRDRRAPRRDAAGRGAGADRARTLRRRPLRPCDARPGSALLGARRHGCRGGGRTRPARHAPPARRHRQGRLRRDRDAVDRGPRAGRGGGRGGRVPGAPLPRLPHARCRARRDQPAGRDQGRRGRRARLQIRSRRRGIAAPARSRGPWHARPADAARGGGRAGRPEIHRARRLGRRARQRRRADDDDHGRHHPLRRRPGQLSRDRRRGLHQVQDRALDPAQEPEHPVAARQFLRRLRPHRCDGRGRRQRLEGARPADPGLLHDPRHRRGRGGRACPARARHRAVRPDGRRGQGCRRSCWPSWAQYGGAAR